uniref:LRP chaperone MESD n=1 Tax=Phallusia mammillata TaxID=59560 RepID=A0A6F9DKU7_9ASCI|nr:LDLR chaperone MESD-like [Phallusia mammillata]
MRNMYVAKFILILLIVISSECKKKDPRDFTDADIHKLEEQWTEDGEVDEGDLPEHLRPSQPVDFSKVDASDPENLVKLTKKHKTLMMFATVAGDPTEEETEKISSLWQSQLYNANIEVTRFVISANRVLFKLSDGSYAYEIKDFLVEQEQCELVTIEGKDYPGKGSTKSKDTKNGAKTKSKKKKAKKTKIKSEL